MLDGFKGVEVKTKEGKYIYYIYVHFSKRKRIQNTDIENCEVLDINFNKIKNVNCFLESKGKIIFDPFAKEV